MAHFTRAILWLTLHVYISTTRCANADYLNNDELTQLTNILQTIQSADKQTILNQRNMNMDELLNQPSEIIPADTDTVSKEGNIEGLKEIDELQNNIKSKRGWEELQRHWRSYFPKRAWEVVRSYWQDPRRVSYRNYVGKRSNEELVAVPVQPGNENEPWMLNQDSYKVDGNSGNVQATDTEENGFETSESEEEDDGYQNQPDKRGWEDIRLSTNDRVAKRGWEDVRLLPFYSTGKRGWEDVRLFQPGRIGKRGWEDVRFSQYRNAVKRGWEDVRFSPFRHAGKRGWEDVRFSTFRGTGKRGWEDVRFSPYRSFGKRGWEDVRFSPFRHVGKRGWEDVRFSPFRHVGKRGWEDVRFSPFRHVGKRGWEDVRFSPYRSAGKRGLEDVSQEEKLGKRGWEDVRFNFNGLGKRGWEDIRLFQGCGCCSSAHSYRHCCISCRARTQKRSVENGQINSDRTTSLETLS